MRIPSRDHFHEDGREFLVGLTDGGELEVWADGTLRRRSRFLRDSEARKYSERLAGRLIGRGYRKANATA